MTRTELIIVLEMPLALHFIVGLFVTKNSKINYHSFGANIDLIFHAYEFEPVFSYFYYSPK